MRKRTSLIKELSSPEFRVTLFGSARVKRGDKIYKTVYDLAKMIGARNIDIVTGGGPGLMEAASAGHEAGSKGESHSVGLLIRLPKWQRANVHLDIKREFSRFSERLDSFMSLSNAVVVAPGGLGTLLELFYTWQLIQVKELCDMPIILLGDDYKDLIKWIKKSPLKHHFMEKGDMGSIFVVDKPSQAIEILDDAHKHFKAGRKNICLNIRKYRP